MKETEIQTPLSLLDQAQETMFGAHNNPDEGIDKIDEHDEDDDGVTDLNPKPKDHDEEEIPDETKDKLDNKPEPDADEEEEETGDEDTSKEDDDEDNEGDTNDEDTSDEDDALDPDEQQQVSDFFDVFAESLGVDVDENNKPDTIEGLTDWVRDRKSTRLNSSHSAKSRMPSSA